MVHSFEVQYTKQSYGLDRDNNTIVIWYFQHVSIVIALNLYCVVSEVVAMSYRRQYKLSIYLDFLENIWVLYRQISIDDKTIPKRNLFLHNKKFEGMLSMEIAKLKQ